MLESRSRNRLAILMLLIAVSLLGAFLSSACTSEPPRDAALLRHTYCELVDWHISGIWVINCPTAWVRIANYNRVPIKDVVLEYRTYDYEGHLLDVGTYALEGEIGAGSIKNFIEQYLGLVSLHSDKLSIKVVGVSAGP